jgi:MYXO-CTERM domain-containing protein
LHLQLSCKCNITCRVALELRFSTLLALALFTAPGAVGAQLPEGCTELGLGLTEHTCFHARFGPFEERSADSSDRASDTTDDINPVHTHFRVTLPGPESVIAYTPERTGEWAVFVDPDVPLRVLAPDGAERAVLLSHDVETCPYLPRLRVYALEQGQRYSIVLGPTSATEAVLVNEKVDDFVTAQGRDGDGDGFGASEDAMVSPCVAPEGFADNDTDCDDSDRKVHPDAAEVCDGIDQNCNGLADDIGASCTAGSGPCASTGKLSCPVEGEPARCSAEALETSAKEICNGEDDDCDGMIDNASAGELCGDDPTRPRCVSSGSGFHCGCERDSDCGGPDSGSICKLDGSVQRCVSGCVEGRNGCPEGQRCTSSDPARPGFCAACCSADEDCSSERPRCAPLQAAEELLMCGGDVIGAQWYYEHGSWHFEPVRSEARMCVECVEDKDCAEREDGRVACIGPYGTCARCNGQDVSRCSERAEGAACLRDGDCGCRTDADCASDRECKREQQRCEERTAKPEREGDQAGRRSAAMMSEPLVTLDGGTEEDAATRESRRSDADAGVSDAGENPVERAQERSGCSCSAAGSGSGSRGWLSVPLLAGLALLRRRRWHSMSALCALLVGCSAYDAPPRVGEAARMTTSDDADGGAPSAADELVSAEDKLDEQAAADGSGCTPELGEPVLEHSCQHAMIGPFIDVSAAPTRELAPAEVSASHKTFRVKLPTEADAEFVTDGWLRYRPTRNGQHVLLVKPSLDVRMVAADSGSEQRRLHEQPIDTCPDTLEHGFVYELERGVTYYLGMLREADEALLFVEHIETFGKGAWADECVP